MPALWLDTSVAYQPGSTRELARLARAKGVRVCVPAEVHLERSRQLRCERGDSFDPAIVDSVLRSEGLDVRPLVFDRARAEVWAGLLARRYPSAADFDRAKARCLPGQVRDAVQLAVSSMPMTTDWLIALQVEEEHLASRLDPVRVAVEDHGEEWKSLRELVPPIALDIEQTKRWLETLPDRPQAGEGYLDPV